MVKKTDILFSEYIIDGVSMDTTPADMLKECMPAQYWDEFLKDWQSQDSGRSLEPIIDETSDRIPANFKYDCGKAEEYLKEILQALSGKGTSAISPDHPRSATRLAIAESILDSIWREGHFRLNNLNLTACWEWDPALLGNMAAFYISADAASGYIYDLGVRLVGLEIRQEKDGHDAAFRIDGVQDWLPDSGMADTVEDTEYEPKEKVWLWNTRKCPGLVTAGSSRLIYIPFDTCQHRLGGSALAGILGKGNENGPEIMDPDYFIDCFEVIRELVEDGIVLSGVTVGRGGLMTAVARMLGYGGKSGKTYGIELDISGIEQAYIETDCIRILFAEIPGVIIQVSDDDYDYIDSQLLLQDIAYYPVGVPRHSAGQPYIRLSSSSRTGLSAILAALMDGQSSEGED